MAEPPECLALQRSSLPFPDRTIVKKQDNPLPAVAPGLIGKSQRAHGTWIERQPKLLANLPRKRKARIFLAFHLSTGEFPLPRVSLSGEPLLQQQAAVRIPDRRGDYRQPCRLFFHGNVHREPFLNAVLTVREAGTKIGGSRAMTIMRKLQRLMRDNRGATAIEYGLILAMVFLAMMGAVVALGTEESSLFNKVSSTSVTAMRNAV